MRISFFKNSDPSTGFYRNLSLLLALVILAIYFGLYLRSNHLLMNAVKQQAASYFDLIVRVRRWNANYGGVYVEKKDKVLSNKYLREVGIEPDIVSSDGRTFTLRNPALMTKEISTILSELNGVQFHITSLQLLNKENAPDLFEQHALKRFTEGEREVWEIDRGTAGPRFRYMAPLLVEQSCQRCHAAFNYRVGDVRGGISVSIPLAPIQREMIFNRYVIITLSAVTLFLLLGSTYIMLSQLISKINTAQQALQEASITDELTGLRNRRYLMKRFGEEYERSRRSGGSIGFLMMDLDHFKRINDSYGHPFGDIVLKSAAHAISETIREYDIAGRYGGEEFAVLASETNGKDLVALAERIRKNVAALKISDQKASTGITISIGVAILEEGDTTETLLKRADNALYEAKGQGRNRTVLI